MPANPYEGAEVRGGEPNTITPSGPRSAHRSIRARMWSQLRRRSAASGPVTCSPLGLTISQCSPTNESPSEAMMPRYSARWAAVISPGVSASVYGAISIPVYPAFRIALQASAKGHLSKASLQMEWRNSMNYQCTGNAVAGACLLGAVSWPSRGLMHSTAGAQRVAAGQLSDNPTLCPLGCIIGAYGPVISAFVPRSCHP